MLLSAGVLLLLAGICCCSTAVEGWCSAIILLLFDWCYAACKGLRFYSQDRHLLGLTSVICVGLGQGRTVGRRGSA